MLAQFIPATISRDLAILAHLPLLFTPTPESAERFFEFFTVQIRNQNTRRAYYQAVCRFAAWCEGRGLRDLGHIRPLHVAAYVEELGRAASKPTVKQHLAAIRMLFDWLVTGQVIGSNPAHAVRGPRHSVRKGKTPVLSAGEMGALLASRDTGTLVGLRDRALIALMAYTFARVGAAIQMQVEDYFVQRRRGWVRLQEKGGKSREIPCHHNLEQYLEAWLEASGLRSEPGAPLFPTLRHGRLSTPRRFLPQANVYRMVQRRAAEAGIETRICCHTFRATGITTYLQNGGKLEIAQQMAGHESARTTGLYDRRDDTIALDEVERVAY